MPALVSVLNSTGLLGAERGRKDNKKSVLEGEEGEVDFATLLVFACLAECTNQGVDEGWKEEVLLIDLEQ